MKSKLLFHILLVLTFIGSGLSALSYFLMALLLPSMVEARAANPGLLPHELDGIMDVLLGAPRLYYFSSALLYAVSLAGAIMMWNLRRAGFHLYTVAQLLLIGVPVAFLGHNFFDLGNVMMTMFFVAFYFVSLRNLTAAPEPQESPSAPSEPTSDEDDEQ